VKSILKAAAKAEIAAKVHWRSDYLAHLTHCIDRSSQPEARRFADLTRACEIEAIIKDLEAGQFASSAGALIVV
jgi:hypothetical protein